MRSQASLDPLVERARRGDAAALEELLASVAPAIVRFGRRMCKNAHDADDVLQDTLLAVATHLGEFEGRSSLSSWAFTLARTACARRRRGLKNQPPVDAETAPEMHDERPSPEAQATDRQLAAALSRALDSLPDEHREAILLRDVEGLTAPDAAASLGISVDAMKSRLHRARTALREALRPVLEPAAPQATPACPDVLALWSRKLEGDLSPTDCAEMEQHLLGCPACGAACNALKHALLACRSSATDDVDPQVKARITSAVRAWTTQNTLRKG